MPRIAANDVNGDLAIFARVLRNAKGKMTGPLARYVLTLGFNAEDQARMQHLATRNQQGALSQAEASELTGYVRAGHLLALLQSQARLALKEKQVS